MQVFFASTDPRSEAAVLVEALQLWLDDQKPEQQLRAGKASFKYGVDGNLRTVNVALLEEDDE